MSDILTTRLKDRMEKMGSNPTTLSTQSGLNRVAVRDILVGKSKNPSVETIQKIAASLECSVAYLIGEIDTPVFVKGSPPLELASGVELPAQPKPYNARLDTFVAAALSGLLAREASVETAIAASVNIGAEMLKAMEAEQ